MTPLQMYWIQLFVNVVLGLFSPIVGAFVAILVFNRSNNSDTQRHAEAMAADNARHREALEADEAFRRSERENDEKSTLALRNRLVVSLLTEIKTFHDFLRITQQANQGYGYIIEFKTLFDTVPDQIRLFHDLGLITELSLYRHHVKTMMTAAEVLNHATDATSGISVARGNWSHWVTEGKKLNNKMRELLLKELDGNLPEVIKNWQAN